MIYVVFSLWFAWCLGNLLLAWIVHRYVPADTPRCTGFGISIPSRYVGLLTIDEYTAIYAHELGHQHHKHAWKNYARLCVFFPVSRTQRMQQELEADDYAANCTDGLILAAALRKLSSHPTDVARARRLELRHFIPMDES